MLAIRSFIGPMVWGDIVRIEEKTIDGELKKCYVVQVLNMMTWIPIDEFQQHSLRMPTPPGEFDSLFEILKRSW